MGYRHYIDECKKNIAEFQCNDVYDMEKRVNWEAMIIVMEAIINFSHRYADLAEKQAAECADEKRKQELLTMAENCRTVPEHPAQTFQQACQMVWLTHLCICLEAVGGDHCLGRFDQYTYPFWQKESSEGKDEVYFQELIHEFKLKVAELWNIRQYKESIAVPGCPLWMHVMLGGVTEDGKDACNEVTDIFLRCLLNLQTDEPCISFRYHQNVNEETFRLAIRAARDTGGHPAFYNDDSAIIYLLSLGFTLKEARNWGICGCIEPIVLGKTDFQSNSGNFNTNKVLEIALHDGVDPLTGKQLGPKTGKAEDFKCIDDVKRAFETQLDFFMEKLIRMHNATIGAHGVMFPTITASCFSQGCIEKGKVLQQKGSDHHYTTVSIASMANTIDSFAAIEECVFNKKNYLTMGELADLLDSNFEGKENMRQMLINKAPKFGNNIEQVDKYGYYVVNTIDDSLHRFKDAHGGQWTSLHATVVYNVEMGKRLEPFPMADLHIHLLQTTLLQ